MVHVLKTVSFAGRREHNEDAVLRRSGTIDEVPVSLIAVADGMGGHAAGDVASQLAIETLQDRWLEFLESGGLPDLDQLRRFVRAVYAQINTAIARRCVDDPHLEGMGTTLVSIFALGQRALVANIGDSRAYVLKEAGLTQVSDDHSVVADSIRRGLITPDEAHASPYSHALTRALDGEEDMGVDIYPEDGWLKLPEDCVLLACSDGLSNAVTVDQFERCILGLDDLGEAAEELVALAYEQGSQDNVSLAALEVNHLSRTADPLTNKTSTHVLDEPAPNKASANRMWLALSSVFGFMCLCVVYVVYFAGDGCLEKETAVLSINEPGTMSLPFGTKDRLRWRVSGTPNTCSPDFQVRFFNGMDQELFKHSVMKDTALYLSDLHANQRSMFGADSTYRWQVLAFADGDTLKSVVTRLSIGTDSTKSQEISEPQ